MLRDSGFASRLVTVCFLCSCYCAYCACDGFEAEPRVRTVLLVRVPVCVVRPRQRAWGPSAVV